MLDIPIKIVARWGYSSVVGAWVLIDELDAVGDVVGSMRRRTGWVRGRIPSATAGSTQ